MNYQLFFSQLVCFTDQIIKEWDKNLDNYQNIVLITGGKSFDSFQIKDQMDSLCAEKNIAIQYFPVSGEPTVQLLDDIKSQISSLPDLVIGLGGGSVMDTAKALSMILLEEGSIEDYLESVGTKKTQDKKIPLWLCPTTAGTGSESTQNAVIAHYEKGYKKSLRHNILIPDKVFIDSVLNSTTPRETTIYSGLDALVQLLEAYFSKVSYPFITPLCEKGIECFISSFPKVLSDPHDLEARQDISFAAYLSGGGITHVGVGVIHGIAGPLGGLSKINHGTICARLVYSTHKLLHHKAQQTSNQEFLTRYDKISSLLGRDLLGVLEEIDQMLPSYSFNITPQMISSVLYPDINRNALVHLSMEEIRDLLLQVF